MDELIFIKINFYSLEDTIKKTERKAISWEETATTYISDKRIVSRIYLKTNKNALNYSIIRGETTQLKFLQNILIETYEWQ